MVLDKDILCDKGPLCFPGAMKCGSSSCSFFFSLSPLRTVLLLSSSPSFRCFLRIAEGVGRYTFTQSSPESAFRSPLNE